MLFLREKLTKGPIAKISLICYTYLLIGLDKAIGVGTPIALIRCCIVGLGPDKVPPLSKSGV